MPPHKTLTTCLPLQNTPGGKKNPPHFLSLLTNNTVVGVQGPSGLSVGDLLQRTVKRGDKLLTGSAKEDLDKLFTKVVVHTNLPLTSGESPWMQNFLLEVSKGSYTRPSYTTVRALVTAFAQEGKNEAKRFVSRARQDGRKLSLTGDLWSDDGTGLFGIVGHYIDEDWKIQSKLLGLISCGHMHHTGKF